MKHLTKLFIFFIVIMPVNGQIFFSEYAEGSSYNKYLEIYNYSSTIINLSEYGFPSCSNGCDAEGEWDYMNYFPDGASIGPGDIYVITHPYATDPSNDYYTEDIAIYSDHQFSYLSNGDDVFALINIETGVIIDVIGEVGPDPGTGWDVAGVTNATKDHTLVRKSSVVTGNSGNWGMSAGTSIDDSEWIVFENETWDNLGFHNYDNNNSGEDILGCMCPDAMNYMPTATIDDGTCIVYGGCTDSSALNYSGDLCLSAEFIDEDCQYENFEISGCYNDEMACNNFDFSFSLTSGNMTIALSNLTMLMEGDIVGVFYTNENGFLGCGGSVVFEGDQVAIAAWGDNPSTATIDGFQAGDSFIVLVLREEIVYETTIILNNEAPFTASYSQNGFGQVLDLEIVGPFNSNCIFPEMGYDCDGNTNPVNILENNMQDKKVLVMTDLSGRLINSIDKSQLYLVFYSDGTVEKKYCLNH